MNKKGFTLIEMLGVIIVLGLIALIISPLITKVLSDNQKKIFKNSAIRIIDAAKVKYTEARVTDVNKYQVVLMLPTESLEMDYAKDMIGLVSYNKNDESNIFVKNDKWCAIKKTSDGEVKVYSSSDAICTQEITPALCFETQPLEGSSSEVKITKFLCGDKINKEGKITFKGTYRNVIIPERINAKIVKMIDNYAFSINTSPDGTDFNKQVLIDSIDMSKTRIETIGSHAFYNNHVGGVKLPSTIKNIQEYAFMNNCIGELDISNANTIGNSAFAQNDLTKVSLPTNSSYNTVSASTFDSNYITSVKIDSNVTSIGSNAFSNNVISKLVIPNSVTTLSLNSFAHNNIKELTLSNNISNIAESSFAYNSLESINLPSSVITISDKAFDHNELTSLTFPSSLQTIKKYAFAHNRINTMTIPNTIKNIENSAFNNNNMPDDKAFIFSRINGVSNTKEIISYAGLKKENVILPNAITNIGEECFRDTDLKSVTISNSVTSIANNSFLDNHLITIDIPNSVTSLGEYAFSKNNLSTVNIKGKSATSDFIVYAPTAFYLANDNGPTRINWE